MAVRRKQRGKPRAGFTLLALLLAAIFCFSGYKLLDDLLTARREQNTFASLAALKTQNAATEAPATPAPTPSTEPTDAAPVVTTQEPDRKTEPDVEPTPAPEENTEPKPLPEYAQLYEMNPEFFGWLTAEAVELDYPVMHSPTRPEYYLNRDYYGEYSGSGTPFIDGRCPPDGNFFLIYGHRMQNKTVFGQLSKYTEESFRNEHPMIYFDTVYEHREYEIMAVFYSQIYLSGERGVFRYYDYADLTDEATFTEYVRQVKASAIYDTGIDAVYGDELIALSTCNYHAEEGRLVVVAKRIA